jgi:CheY-like chemotaxis protein
MRHFENGQLVALVIDDDRKVLDTATAALSGAGFACLCCTTPDEAISAAEATPPHLILCDTHLQGENGQETCRRIKQQPGLEEVPVMFLSRTQLPDIIRRSADAGGVYCLRKPLDAKVLVGLVDQAFAVPQA